MKICKKCNKERDIKDYYKQSQKYLRLECKWCTSKINHEKYMKRKIRLVRERKHKINESIQVIQTT